MAWSWTLTFEFMQETPTWLFQAFSVSWSFKLNSSPAIYVTFQLLSGSEFLLTVILHFQPFYLIWYFSLYTLTTTVFKYFWYFNWKTSSILVY